MFIADILVRDTSRMPATRTRVAALANMSRRVAKVSAAAMAIVTAAANQSRGGACSVATSRPSAPERMMHAAAIEIARGRHPTDASVAWSGCNNHSGVPARACPEQHRMRLWSEANTAATCLRTRPPRHVEKHIPSQNRKPGRCLATGPR